MLEKAIQIAVQSHQGQRDKAGQPYILHPLALMQRMDSDIARIVAVLHDVIEDSECTLGDLQQRGFSPEVLEALYCLTRVQGEPYEAFIERIRPNPLARAVKIADLEHNMDIVRIPAPADRDWKRLKKYRRAWWNLARDVRDADDLAAWLQDRSVDLSEWGVKPAKSVANLWAEIVDGESQIQDRPLVRVVNVAVTFVRRGGDILIEAEQEFGDGSRRRRDNPPSEKARPGEAPASAAERGLREELGEAYPDIEVVESTCRQEIRELKSPSYPGLLSQYVFYVFESRVSGLPNAEFWTENAAYGPGDPVKRHLWRWQPEAERLGTYLEEVILPELEAGRPNWDGPHTLAVVHWLQEILAHSPGLDVDPLVLRIAAYAHDWGYAGLFRGDKPVGYDAGQAAKSKHMELGAQKLEQLLQDRRFVSLTPAQRQRCVHLVMVHDDLEQLQDQDELVLMEADTLAALDVDRVEPDYGFAGNARYMQKTRGKRMDRFITDYGRVVLEGLYAKREDYYRRMCQVIFLGTGDAFSAGERSTSAVLIRTADSNLLLEAGPAIMGQLARAKIKACEIERLFVSHAHGDHVLGFPMLALERRNASTPLHVYGGMNALATLARLCRIVYPMLSAEQLNVRWHELSETTDDEVQLAKGYTLQTAVVPYPEGVPTLAARWEWAEGPSVVFVTDTFPSEASARLARGSDLLIHEASFSEVLQPDIKAQEYNHSTVREAGELARQAGCGRLALVHLGSDIGERPDVLAQEARAGTDLQVIVPQDGDDVRLFRES